MSGRLRQSHWDDKDTGEKRSMIQLDVDEIGPSLRFATATVRKLSRSGSNGNGHGDGNGRGAPADDPWAAATPDRPATSGAFTDDEPPF
jgi:single-strand DNA-binding protein